MNNSIVENYKILFEILSAWINKKKIKIKIKDYNQLFKISKKHSITASVCCALEYLELINKIPQDIANKFMDEKIACIHKTIIADEERNKLFSFMNNNKIWYAPLKGIILKELYPSIGSRQMADNDILFDQKYKLKIKKYMESQGFETLSYNKGNHDTYIKKPTIFEMHRELFSPIEVPDLHNKILIEYYSNIKEKLKREDHNEQYYHFSDEDFYIYCISHIFKHYDRSGIGIRSLIDIYIYYMKKPNMDYNYIKLELKKLQLEEFEETINSLSKALFSKTNDKELDDEQYKMLLNLINAGTYGNRIQWNKNEIQKIFDCKTIDKKQKIKYIFVRLFPNIEWFKIYHPFFYKHKLLIPFYYVYRIIKCLIFRRKYAVKEIKAINSIEN